MKTNELMIGDWVAYIPEIEEGEDSYLGEPRNIQVDLPCLERIDELIFAPIPLTPEILEKNGFERRGGVSYHKSITGLIIPHWNDSLCFLNYSKKNIPPIMIPFHYVHELQHALRLCGLNDLADNFKV